MSCCVACFEYATRENAKREDQVPQGHILCGVPTEEEEKWFLAGSRPSLVNNRWAIGPSNYEHRSRTPTSP
jgi:hypothetical protein